MIELTVYRDVQIYVGGGGEFVAKPKVGGEEVVLKADTFENLKSKIDKEFKTKVKPISAISSEGWNNKNLLKAKVTSRSIKDGGYGTDVYFRVTAKGTSSEKRVDNIYRDTKENWEIIEKIKEEEKRMQDIKKEIEYLENSLDVYDGESLSKALGYTD